MADKEEKEEVTDCSNPDVVTKYRTAGDISNGAVKHVVDLCKAGAKILDLCVAGDKYIDDAVSKIYKGKDVAKGIGFPTCVSVNNVVGHFSPLNDEAVLAAGDIVKLDLGTNVDGFVAQVATTLCIGAEGAVAATGKAGDLLAAVYNASELAIRMLKIGAKNTPITEMIAAIADDFKVNAIHGVLSHQLEKNVIDGQKTIINKQDIEEKVDEISFEPAEAYAIDIVMSTGEGKPKEVDERTTVFKRNVDETYSLKMKASRAVLSDITTRFPTFPFTMRALDSKTGSFGMKECVTHDLVRPYPVLLEKAGELVAQAKFTALLLPNGTIKVTGTTPGSFLTPDAFKTELKVTNEEYVKLLATAAQKKKKKNKKKPAKKADGAAGGAKAEDEEDGDD